MITTCVPLLDQERADTKPHVPDWLLLVLSITLLTMTASLLWSFNRGLNLGDEGMYQLCYADPKRYTFPSSFAILGSVFPNISGCSVVNYRVLHLASRLAGAAILAWGACDWSGRKWTCLSNVNRAYVYLVALIANLGAFALLPPSLSYNGQTAFLLFAATGLILSSDAAPENARRGDCGTAIKILVAGFCVGLCSVVKLPCAAVFLVLAIGFLARRLPSQIGWLLLGLTSAGLLYFGFMDNFDDWIHRCFFDFSSYGGDHSPLTLARAYVSDTLRTLARASVVVIPPATIIIARTKYGASRKAAAVSAGLIIAAIAYVLKTGYLFKTNFYFAAALAAFLFAIWSAFTDGPAQRRWQLNGESLCGLALLGAVPFVCSAGTNTELFWHAATNVSPLLVMSALILIGLGPSKSAFFRIWCGCLTAWISLFFVYGAFLHPFILDSIFDQTVAQSNARLRGLFLDSKTADAIQALESMLASNGFRKGDPIVSLNGLPGLVYAVGGVAVDCPFLSMVDRPNQCCQALKDGRKTYKQMFVLIDCTTAMPEAQLTALQEIGCPYPESFEIVGEIPVRVNGSKFKVCKLAGTETASRYFPRSVSE